MTSNININNPTDKNSSTESIRNNFAITKIEIEELQTGKADVERNVNGDIVSILNNDRSVALKLNSMQKIINFNDYASPNLTSSVTDRFVQACNDAISENMTLYVPKGRYKLLSVATINNASGLRIIGDGVTQTIFEHTSNSYMMDIKAGIYGTTAVNLTANANAGDITVQVLNTAPFSVNQWVNIQSNKIWDLTSTKNARFGELAQIKNIVENTSITFYCPLDYSYTTEDMARINSCPLGNGIVLKDFGLSNLNPNTAIGGVAGGLVIRQALNPYLENLYAQYLDGPFITYSACVGAQIKNVTASFLADDEINNRFGYVHNINGPCRSFVIFGGSSYACRHYTTTNANSADPIGGVPVHHIVMGHVASAYTNVAFDTHEEGDDITFTGCVAQSCLDIGFGMRAKRCTLDTPVVTNGKGTGILIRSTATDSSIYNAKVSDLTGTNSLRNNPTVGIDIQAMETVLDGFNIKNTGQSALRVLGVNRSQIRNGRIKRFGTSGFNIIGIHFSGASFDHEIQDVRIDGDGISLSSGIVSGVDSNQVTGVKITNTTIRRCSNTQLNIQNVNEQTVQGTSVTETVINSILV